jgi:hypothetical protein
MTGDDDGERIARKGSANGPRTARNPQTSGNPSVSTHPAPWNSVFSQEDSSLKFRASFESNDIQCKINSLALKKTLNSLTKFSNGGAR